MKSITLDPMNFLTSLLTALFCVAQAGCAPGNIGEPPNPKITFELPAEWANFQETEYKQKSSWYATLPGNEDAPEGFQGSSKFWMGELNGANDSIYPGATSKEKAEKYYEQTQWVCRPENANCIVEPIRKIEHAGIKAYVIVDNNNEGTAFDYWVTSVFFEKDHHMFEMGMRNKFEEEITQKTIKRVLETLKIGN